MRTAMFSLVLVIVTGTGLRSDAARGGPVPTPPDVEAAVRAAIVAAVQERLGASAEVTVDHLWMPAMAAPVSGLTATIEPGARLGRPVHFRLMAAAGSGRELVRFASVVASLSVRVEHARLVTAVRPGTALTPDQTMTAVDRVADVRIERLPRATEVVGARVRQMLPAGVVIEEWMIEREAAVRSSEIVGVRAVVGGVEARGLAKASERGAIGSVIRLINTQSGRTLKGRVVSRGEVEVVQ